MNKIDENRLKLYILRALNFIDRLYEHKAIFPYAFLMNSKMYV